jgi:hypothetical protein
LQSLKEEEEHTTCPYILREEDLILLKQIVLSRQLPIWSFHKAEAGDIGSFVPFAIMHETKKTEVEDSNQEVNKRLATAIKRLIKQHGLNEGERN